MREKEMGGSERAHRSSYERLYHGPGLQRLPRHVYDWGWQH